MNFFNWEQDFFYKFRFSSFLSWKGFFYFEDIFFLDKDVLLELYYFIPRETFALSLQGCKDKYKSLLLSMLDEEERIKLHSAIASSSGDTLKARETIEREFLDGMFLHREFRCSVALEDRKARQIVRLFFYVSNLLRKNDKERLNKIINTLPFWISIKIMDLLCYSECLKYMELLEEGKLFSQDPLPGVPLPFIKYFTEDGNLPKEFLEIPFFTGKVDFKFFSRLISRKASFHFKLDYGRRLLASQAYKEAEFFLLKACNISYANFLAHWSYSRVLYILGNREEALHYYRLALDKNSQLNKYHLFNAYSLRIGGKMTKAIEELKMLTYLSPEYPYGFKLLGRLYMVSGKFTEAIECFEQSMGLLPDDVEAYLALVDCYIQKGEMEKAEETAFKCLDFAKDDFYRVRVYFKLGEIHKELENKEKALDFYKKSIEIQKDYCPALTALGLLENSLGNKKYAREYLVRLVSLQPNMIWIRKTLAEIYLEEGETDLAIEELSAVIDFCPEDFSAVSRMKEICERFGIKYIRPGISQA